MTVDELMEDQNISFHGIEHFSGHHAGGLAVEDFERKGGPNALGDRHWRRRPGIELVTLPGLVRLEDEEVFPLGDRDRMDGCQKGMESLILSRRAKTSRRESA